MENIFTREQRARATGRWPPWRWHDIHPDPGQFSGWLLQARRAAENGVFSVMVREIKTEWGIVTHAFLRTASNAIDITWAEKQKIKDELFGRERIAIEVFPPRSELVDGADMFHLWVMPAGFEMPFTLADREQRP